MLIYETFAKRKQNAELAGKPIAFRHDTLPDPFRAQVANIWDDTIGDPGEVDIIVRMNFRNSLWIRIHNEFFDDLGVYPLSKDGRQSRRDCVGFLLKSSEVDQVLSLIEIFFAYVQPIDLRMGSLAAADAIDKLNHRFREHAIGYQFAGGQIIPVESQYIHTEAVEPAISLMYDAQFDGPLQEFMQAHEHHRKGNNKEAIVNAQNAFESTMKAICDQQGWAYVREKATAQNLLKVLFDNGLIPAEMQSHFTALRSTLESGLPTVRNRGGRGGHGQGSDVVDVPDYLAAYCLHLAATNIVLLIEAHNASK